MLTHRKQSSTTHPREKTQPPQSLLTKITTNIKIKQDILKARDKSKMQLLISGRDSKSFHKEMLKTKDFTEMKASTIMSKLPELHTPELTIQLSNRLRQKLKNVPSEIYESKENINPTLPPLKQSTSSNYNPKSKNPMSMHRQKIIELQQWLKKKLEHPPLSLEESMEYRDVIMALGMEQIIKIIGNRCREQGEMVSDVWQITWAICREIMLYLSKKLRKCEQILDQQVHFYRKNYTQRIDNLEKQNQFLKKDNKQLTSLRNKMSHQIEKTKKQNKNLRIKIISLQDMNNQLRQNFEAVLKQNLLLHLKQEPISEQKKKWVKRSYQSFITLNDRSPPQSRFKDYAKELIKTQMSQDHDDIAYEPSIFEITCNLNVLKEQEIIRRSQIDEELKERHRCFDKMTQTTLVKLEQVEINTDLIQKNDNEVQTEDAETYQKQINTTVTHACQIKPQKNGNKKGSNINKKIKNSKEGKKKEKKENLVENKMNEVETPKQQMEKLVEKEQQQIKQQIQKTETQEEQNKFANLIEIEQEEFQFLKKRERKSRNYLQPSIHKTLHKNQYSLDRNNFQKTSSFEEKQEPNQNRFESSTEQMQIDEQILDETQKWEHHENKEQLSENNQVMFNQGELLSLLREKEEKIDELEDQIREIMQKYDILMDGTLRSHHFGSISPSKNSSSKKILSIQSISKKYDRSSIIQNKNSKVKSQSKNSHLYLLNQPGQAYLKEYQMNEEMYHRTTDKTKLNSFDSIKFLQHSDPQSSLTSQKTLLKVEQHYYEDSCFLYFERARQKFIEGMNMKQSSKFPINNEMMSKGILEQYRDILKCSKNTKQFSQKHSQNCIEKSLFPVIKDLFKDLQNAIKNEKTHELKTQYQLLPVVMVIRFNRMYGVKTVASKHLRDLFSSLVEARKNYRKYDILIYFLMDSHYDHPMNIELLFVYLLTQLTIDPYFSQNKTMEDTHFQTIKDLSNKYLTTDPIFNQKMESIKNEFIQNNERNFINFFKSFISAYQEFYEQRTAKMNLIYKMLAWKQPLNFLRLIKFVSILNKSSQWHKSFVLKLSKYLFEERIFQRSISLYSFNKFIIQCPEFSIIEIQQSFMNQNKQLKEVEENKAQRLKKIQQSDDFISGIARFLIENKLLAEQQQNFIEKYCWNYVVETQVNKLMGILSYGAFNNRTNSLILAQEEY